MGVTFTGTVTEIESTGPPEIDPPPEPPVEDGGGVEVMQGLRTMRDSMPGHYRMPVGWLAKKTPQEAQQEYGIATGGAVAQQSQGATERENEPPRVDAREGLEEEEPKLWVHIHIALDEPHVGELQVNAPESQVGGMLVMGGRARVTVSSN